MLFGIPITISKGGIIPDKIVTLYPNKCNIPSDQTTPTNTIRTGTKTALKERKNIKRTIIQIKSARALNMYNSVLIFIALTTRIYGSPE